MDSSVIIKAEIHFNPWFICAKCNCKERGDKVTLRLSGTLFDIESSIKSYQNEAADMPVGWANSYETGFNCQECK